MSNLVGTTINLDGIGHLLADSELRVPVYQRSFSWTTEEIGEFLTDLWDSFRRGDAEYFLGSVVLTTGEGDKPSVVDGQQRLATVSMIYGAISAFLREKGDRRADPLAARYLFSLNLRTEETEPKLRLNETDDDFFRKLVLGNTSAPRAPSASADSHKRIKAGYQMVRDKISSYAKTASGNEAALLIEWVEFLEKNAKIIVVRVPDEANAFIIFETPTQLMKYALAFVPGDAQFQAAFSTATVSQAFLARYYLQALEQSLRGEKNPELVPNTLEQEVNLEHILPQNPKLKEWPHFTEESVAANVKRLGNLTLLKADENNAGGNRPFATKKPAFVRSKLHLNYHIARHKNWTAESIAARQAALAQVATTTWPLKA